MCGIAGILVKDGLNLDPADLRRLADALAHRGPDGEGIWVSTNRDAALVHRRLAILDVSDRGHQPMHSSDGAYTIVFNGEIFNFIELREQLSALGSVFRSDSDTEVILEAWRHWRKGMLPRFNGMWAFAIRDNANGEVFLCRDRFGIKPLLYTQSAGRFAFASEMRVLCTLPWLSRQIDREVATRLLFDPFSIEGGERSLLRDVRRLPAGHWAIVRGGSIEVERWWRTTAHLVAPPPTRLEQAERFRELLFDSVQLRLRSDVAVSTCLSGGFDSSAITCAMARVAAVRNPQLRQASDWRHAFIASFPGQSNDETAQALEAASYAGVVPHVMTLKEDDALAHIDTVLEDFDDVYISLPTAPWQIYRELRRAHVIVSLDGHGADELLGAYRQEGEDFGFILRNLVAWAASHRPGVWPTIESAKAAWLTTQGLNFLRGHRSLAPSGPGTPFDEDELPEEWGGLNRRLYRMFHATVLPTIFRNFDRLSMAHGIEVRMPFTDWRLVTYAMSLPDDAKSMHGMSKFVARQAMSGVVPDSIRLRKRKIGFSSPMPEWLNGPLRPWVRLVLDRANPIFDEIVHTSALRKKVLALSDSHAWDWHSAGRLWPYVNLKWMLDRYEYRS